MAMGGSTSKQPRPSYEDGKVRDPSIEAMQKEQTEDDDDQKSALRDLIKRSVTQRTPSAERAT